MKCLLNQNANEQHHDTTNFWFQEFSSDTTFKIVAVCNTHSFSRFKVSSVHFTQTNYPNDCKTGLDARHLVKPTFKD